MTEAIKLDLNLTADQVADSNLASLGYLRSTHLLRILCRSFRTTQGDDRPLAPWCDPYGLDARRQWVVESQGDPLLHLHSWRNIRILPSLDHDLFDRNIVGTANAFAGGWGNMVSTAWRTA